MKRFYHLLVATIALFAISTQGAMAIDLTGWTKLTAIPANPTNYFYVITDHGSTDLMVGMADAVQNEAGFKSPWYQTAANPFSDNTKVWIIEPNTSAEGGHSFRNLSYIHLPLQIEWNHAERVRTNNQQANVSWSSYAIEYVNPDDYFTVQSNHYPGNYWGRWNDLDEFASNRGANGKDPGHFDIYSISRADYWRTAATPTPYDMTGMLVNPSFEIAQDGAVGHATGWTSSGAVGIDPKNTNPASNPKVGTWFVEKWGPSGSIDWNQTVRNLPAGLYRITANARNEADATVYLYANDQQVALEKNQTKDYSVEVRLITDGDIKLGVKCTNHPANTWFAVDNFRLTCVEKTLDLTALKEALSSAIDNLQELASTKKILQPSHLSDIAALVGTSQALLANPAATEGQYTQAINDVYDLYNTCKAFRLTVPRDDPYEKYLFAYFPSNADENLYYAISEDGFNYTPLNEGQRVMASDTIALKRGIRDPHILRGEDGAFYMVATDMRSADGWDSNRGIVMCKSTDLVHWTHSTVNFPTRFPENWSNVTHVWAPEVIWDDNAGRYMVYFSLLTNDGTCPYDKLYYCYANDDFTDLETEPVFLYDRGSATIDADIMYDATDQLYHMIFKNEGSGGIASVTAEHLTAALGEDPGSQWSTPSPSIQQTTVAVEGGGLFRLIDSNTWVLMYDCYNDGYYQFCTTEDWETFSLQKQTATGGAFTPRHGAVLPITPEEYAALLAAFPVVTPAPDMTSCIVNPSFETGNANGWTSSGAVGITVLKTNPADNPKVGTWFAEKFGPTGTIDWNQTISHLPAGNYTITVRARNQADVPVYLYANDQQVALEKNQTKDYSVEVTLSTFGDIKLGVTTNGEAHPADTWFAVDDFRLTYTPDIKNLNFTGNADGWEGFPATGQPTYANNGAEAFNTNFDIYQAVAGLPNGLYSVKANAFYRAGDKGTTNDAQNVVLYANEAEAPIASINSEAYGSRPSGYNKGQWEAMTVNIAGIGYVPDNANAAQYAINDATYGGRYQNEVKVYVTDGTLRFGIKKNTTITNDWCYFDNFSVTYLGDPKVGLALATKDHPVDASIYLLNKDASKWHGWWLNDAFYKTNDNVIDGQMLEVANWNATSFNSSATQTVYGLPSGRYELRTVVQASADCEYQLQLGDSKSEAIAGHGVTGGDTGTKGWDNISIRADVQDGQIVIGCHATAEGVHKWANFDNFELWYYGEDVIDTPWEDITEEYIKNAKLTDGLNDWTATNFSATAKQANSVNAAEAYAGWASLEKTDYSLLQTVTLPAGNYKIVSNSLFRQGVEPNTDARKSLAYLVANEVDGAEHKYLIKTLGSASVVAYAAEQRDGTTVTATALQSAAGVLSGGMYNNSMTFELTEETTMNIGIVGTFDAAKSWFAAGPFTLYREASSARNLDLTDKIVNPNFENGTTGWNLTGAIAQQTNNEPVKVGMRYVEGYAGKANELGVVGVSQTLALPRGSYELTAMVSSRNIQTWLYAGNAFTELNNTESVRATLKFYQPEDGPITFGCRTTGINYSTTAGGWFAADNFTLKYLGEELEDGCNISNTIVNPLMEEGTTGWSSGGIAPGTEALNTNSHFIEHWSATAANVENKDIAQTYTNLPEGNYELRASIGSRRLNSQLYIGDGYKAFSYPADGTKATETFVNLTTANRQIGLKSLTATVTTDNNYWLALDNVQLVYHKLDIPTFPGMGGSMEAGKWYALTITEAGSYHFTFIDTREAEFYYAEEDEFEVLGPSNGTQYTDAVELAAGTYYIRATQNTTLSVIKNATGGSFSTLMVDIRGKGTASIEGVENRTTLTKETAGATHTYAVTASPEEGYEFVGWYTDPAYQNQISQDLALTRTVATATSSTDEAGHHIVYAYFTSTIHKNFLDKHRDCVKTHAMQQRYNHFIVSEYDDIVGEIGHFDAKCDAFQLFLEKAGDGNNIPEGGLNADCAVYNDAAALVANNQKIGWDVVNCDDQGARQFFEMQRYENNGFESSMSQKLTNLPNGEYLLTFSWICDTDPNTHLIVSALDKDGNVYDGATTGNIDGKGTGTYRWERAWIDVVVTDGTLEIKLEGKCTAADNHHWTNVDDVRLQYLGNTTQTLKQKYEAARASVIAHQAEHDVHADTHPQVYNDRFEDLKNIIQFEHFARYIKKLDEYSYTEFNPDGTPTKTAPKEYDRGGWVLMEPFITQYTYGAIQEMNEFAANCNAFDTFIQKVKDADNGEDVDEKGFDATCALYNPKADYNTSGWWNDSRGTMISKDSYEPNDAFFEVAGWWQYNTRMMQTLTNMPAGRYRLSFVQQSARDWTIVSLISGNTRDTNIGGGLVIGTDGSPGLGWKEMKIEFDTFDKVPGDVASYSAEIPIEAITESYRNEAQVWANFDNFKLTYLGKSEDCDITDRYLQNPDYEVDAAETTTPTAWTVTNQKTVASTLAKTNETYGGVYGVNNDYYLYADGAAPIALTRIGKDGAVKLPKAVYTLTAQVMTKAGGTSKSHIVVYKGASADGAGKTEVVRSNGRSTIEADAAGKNILREESITFDADGDSYFWIGATVTGSEADAFIKVDNFRFTYNVAQKKLKKLFDRVKNSTEPWTTSTKPGSYEKTRADYVEAIELAFNNNEDAIKASNYYTNAVRRDIIDKINYIQSAYNEYAWEHASIQHPYPLPSDIIENSTNEAGGALCDGVLESHRHWSGDGTRKYLKGNANITVHLPFYDEAHGANYLIRATIVGTKNNSSANILFPTASDLDRTASVTGVTGGKEYAWYGGNVNRDGSEGDDNLANGSLGFGWISLNGLLGRTQGLDETDMRTMQLTLQNGAYAGGMFAYYVGGNVSTIENGVEHYVGFYGPMAVGSYDTVDKNEDSKKAIAVDLTQAVFKSVAFNRTNNPNGILFVNAEDGSLVKDEYDNALTTNVVAGDQCANLVLVDNHPFVAHKQFQTTTASYTLTGDGSDYRTVCLPFEIANAPANTYVLSKRLPDPTLADLAIRAQSVAGTDIYANCPLLVKVATSGTTTYDGVANGYVNIVNYDEGADDELFSDDKEIVTFGHLTGTYLQTKVETGDYALQTENGKAIFRQVAAGSEPTINPFRAFIPAEAFGVDVQTRGARKIYIVFDDEIEEEANEEGNVMLPTYDLSGRRVVRPTQSGIYIVNGKKVVL